MEENKLKKNIILALILAASMTMAMTSCGKTGEEVSNGTEQSSYNEAIGIDEAVTEAETEAEVEEVVIEPTQEILAADIAHNVFLRVPVHPGFLRVLFQIVLIYVFHSIVLL